MKTAKKLMALFLTLAICFGLCVPALATNELGVTYQATLDHPELEVSTEEQTVVLTVKTNKTVTLDGVGMEVYCDTGLELAKIENASLGFTAADVNILADKVTGRVSFSTSDAENTTTELLVTLTVTVPANTAAGTYKIGARGINMSKDYGEEWEDDGSAYATLTVKAAEAHVHTMVKTEAKASTCKEQGNNEYYTCTGCGKVYKDAEGKTETTVAAETLPLADHTWGEWTEVKAATETEKGLEERVCSVCGAKETRDIPVLTHTHTMVKTDAKASTCKDQGNNAYYTCTGCGKVYKDAEGKTETTVAAETLPLADHTWGEWTEVKAATETEKGLEERVCSVCGAKETRDIPVLAHTHAMVKTEAKASTCKEQGNNAYYTCTKCGKVYKDAEGKTETTVAAETLPLADHTWGEWTEVKAATETEKGIEERVCSVCGAKETRDIPVLAHTHAMVKTDAKASTCKEQGNNEYYTCTGCGKVYKDAEGKTETTVAAETLPLADHTWGEWVETKAATETEKGIEERVCSVCGAKETRDIPVLSHTHAMVKTDAKASTCKEQGNNEYYTCTGCGKVYKDVEGKTETTVAAETLPLADHTWGEWAETKAATATEAGIETRTCSVCGAKETRETLPLNCHTITFDANGGEVETASALTGIDCKLASLPVPTRASYTFDGWFTAAEEGTEVTVDTAFDADATIYAHWTYSGGYTGGGSSGGSGGGGGGSATTYVITVESAGNGTVTADRKSASKGTTVTLAVKAGDGYELEDLTVTNASGEEISVTGKDGKYTFTMPASKVTVKAAFAEIEVEAENPFVDVAGDAYYADAVIWAAEEGITGGTTATTFSPNAACTRGQAVTFLWRAAGSPAPESSEMPFTDVAVGSYCYEAVLWAVEQGITKGTTETTFSPNDSCTRGQIVTFLWRAVGTPTAGTANPFEDVAAGSYCETAVLWAVENGVTNGTTASTFSPNATCTRAQIVTFLYRSVK